jgi:hypothetical protein
MNPLVEQVAEHAETIDWDRLYRIEPSANTFDKKTQRRLRIALHSAQPL